MDQAIIIQAQAATTQDQAMTTQENWEVVTRPNQKVITMVSRLRYFTQMNPPTFYCSKVDEDPQELIDEVSKILVYGVVHKREGRIGHLSTQGCVASMVCSMEE